MNVAPLEGSADSPRSRRLDAVPKAQPDLENLTAATFAAPVKKLAEDSTRNQDDFPGAAPIAAQATAYRASPSSADTSPMLSETLNLDLSRRAVIETAQIAWQGSRADNVLRKPLERAAAESGRATSIVQFLPGASFPEHVHQQGEEIFVLDGVFSDATGDYLAGSYLRNPPGSQHAPHSRPGCTLLVKLEQFADDDQQRIARQTHPHEPYAAPWVAGHGGLRVQSLHEHHGVHSALVFWPAGERFVPHRHWGGEEIFVIHGEFCDEHGRYPASTWLRNPHGSVHHPFVDQDTLIYVKTGHL